MIINRTIEVKVTKKLLDTIITCATKPEDFDHISQWGKSAARVIVSAPFRTDVNFDGLRVNITKNENIRAVDMLRGYVVQIPGNEVFAIASPDVDISPDQVPFFKHVGEQRMERAWAAYFLTNKQVPDVFIMSAPVLPHVLRDFPEAVLFSNDAWKLHLHNWLKRFMLQHRYFDGTPFGFVKQSSLQPILATLEPDLTPVDTQVATEAPKPVEAKRRGRPRKFPKS